jgi:large subunit ribosomal protein L33
MAKNVNRSQITVECTECRGNNTGGVSRYATEKNKRNTTARLEVKKYCKYEKKRTVHREIK